jgi:hypothetical protein
LHVIAGGGGAFLHPARLAKGGLRSEAQWPEAPQCRKLLGQVPWKIARGRSGVLPHLVLLILFLPAVSFGLRFYDRLGLILAAPVSVTLVLTTIFALIGGVRRRRSVLPLAFAAALFTALLPLWISFGFRLLFATQGVPATARWVAALTLLVSVVLGTFVFGAYLALLTALGFEHTQAFTSLDHPGFKHFVRLRVRADGRGIDGFCIGLADPLRPGESPALVDTFRFRPEAGPEQR